MICRLCLFSFHFFKNEFVSSKLLKKKEKSVKRILKIVIKENLFFPQRNVMLDFNSPHEKLNVSKSGFQFC